MWATTYVVLLHGSFLTNSKILCEISSLQTNNEPITNFYWAYRDISNNTKKNSIYRFTVELYSVIYFYEHKYFLFSYWIKVNPNRKKETWFREFESQSTKIFPNVQKHKGRHSVPRMWMKNDVSIGHCWHGMTLQQASVPWSSIRVQLRQPSPLSAFGRKWLGWSGQLQH